MRPTAKITAAAAVAVHNPRVIAGRIQSLTRRYGPDPLAATVAAWTYRRPARTRTRSKTTFQTTIANAIQSQRATRAARDGWRKGASQAEAALIVITIMARQLSAAIAATSPILMRRAP